MNSAFLALAVISLFFVGYKYYSRFLLVKIFQLDKIDEQPTPAVKYEDRVDFVPTKKGILFGHHFSSIAGAAPIVGPAVAVMWGWLPAILWIVFGVIFMGACHDFGTLVLSLKHKGQSIGKVAESILGNRVRNLFLIIIFFLVWMVIAVFALVIANLFISFPSSVLPVNFEIFIALAMGMFINKNKASLTLPSIIAQALLMLMIYLGTLYPISLKTYFGANELMAWVVFLLVYSFIASTMPVWLLLQPRDYINSHQLVVGLGLLILGLFVTHPPIVAPAINPSPVGAPPLFPFLFITIACGAISGFHGLVSSGTTSKQIHKFTDARPIGYGSMVGEGLLALLATLAATAGFANSETWHQHYSSWQAANGLSAKINAFVIGSGNFLKGLGIPTDYAQTVIAVLIISFAATSLDTASRIQRYIIGEIGETTGIKALKNRYIGSFLAVGTAFLLMMGKSGGKGGLLLWPLFGATNQMLAGLSLLVISIYLIKQKKPSKNFSLPAIFVILITAFSLKVNIKIYWQQENYFLFSLGLILLLTQAWVIFEGVMAIKNFKGKIKN